eukprot:3400427-Pyramimonas_sp.AAC.1
MAVISKFRESRGAEDRPPSTMRLPSVDTGIEVFVRKRPQFEHEVLKGEYDVVTVASQNQVVVHNCQMYPDLKRMCIKHASFPATCAFSQHADNKVRHPLANSG